MKSCYKTTIICFYIILSNSLFGQVQFIEKLQDGYLESVRCVDISPDNQFVYAVGEDGFTCFQRDISTGELTMIIATDTIRAEALRISNSGKFLFMARSNALYVYERNLQTGALTWKSQAIDASAGYYINIRLTQDDGLLAISDDQHET